jgi:hypothetical protein
MKRELTYDIELFPNLFLVVFKDVNTKEIFVFEISKRRNDSYNLMVFLKESGLMIGFNNIMFDYPILHFFVALYRRNTKGKKMVEALYQKGQKLIKRERNQPIRKPYIPQIDLFLINHYDNFAKATSLKILEFNMQMQIIQTLPFAFDKYLTDDEIDVVVAYCHNDIEATYNFWKENIKSISFRQKMSEIYKVDLTNFNDVKIGGVILLKALSKGMNLPEQEIKQMRTHRTAMNMSDIIVPYVKFESKELNTLLDWWKDKVIFETKGQFTELALEDVQPLLPYCNNELKKSKLKNLNIILNGFQFDFGTGGLHGTCHPGVFKANEETAITLIDVSSYYPNLAYYNGMHPNHIPKEIFGGVIKMLYDQRMRAKADGDMETVKSIKLSLNGYLYGNSNSQHSFMYDPQFMMSICVNGQLLLTNLAEQCMKIGKVIQVNTDGVMIEYPKSMRNALDEIVKEWEKMTQLSLDYDHFDLVIQRDVNNYLGVYTNGKIKYKGVFDYNYAENGDWHKNFSMLIVAKALEAYFVNGINPEQFIKNHKDYNDFFKRTKFNRNTKLIARTFNQNGELESFELLQNITRYYVAKNGSNFVKIMPPLKGKTEDREFVVESGYKCTEMNTITPEVLKRMAIDIDYDYYITKVKENIAVIEDYIAIEDLSFEIIDDTI